MGGIDQRWETYDRIFLRKDLTAAGAFGEAE